MQVNLKLFAPEPNRKKAILLFVIRDKTRTPPSKLFEVRWPSCAAGAADDLPTTYCNACEQCSRLGSRALNGDAPTQTSTVAGFSWRTPSARVRC